MGPAEFLSRVGVARRADLARFLAAPWHWFIAIIGDENACIEFFLALQGNAASDAPAMFLWTLVKRIYNESV